MPVSVLAAKGWEPTPSPCTVDNRHTHSLAAVETLDNIWRAQREHCSTSDPAEYSALGAGSNRKGPAQHAAPEVSTPIRQQTAAGAPAADPLRSAAIKQTAQQLNARGIFDSDVNELRSRLMHMARQHRMLASRRPPPATVQPASKTKLDETTTAGRLEAALETVLSSLQPAPAARPRKTTHSSHAHARRSTGSRCTTPAIASQGTASQGTASPAHTGSPRSPKLRYCTTSDAANSGGSRPATAQQRAGVWALGSSNSSRPSNGSRPTTAQQHTGAWITSNSGCGNAGGYGSASGSGNAASPMGSHSGLQTQGFAALPEEPPTIWEAPEGRCGSAGSSDGSSMDAAAREEQAAAREERLRSQMAPGAYAEHVEARQAATEGRLQLYRAQVHARQRALLEAEGVEDPGSQGCEVEVVVARREAATDKAMATMQQLVEHLVARDVAPTDLAESTVVPEAALSPADLERAAASARLKAATHLPDLIAATEAHTRLLTQDLLNSCGMSAEASAQLSPRSLARAWRAHVQQAQQQEQAVEAAIGSSDWLAATAGHDKRPITNLQAAKLMAVHGPRQALPAADATPRGPGRVAIVSGVWGAEASGTALGTSEGSYGESTVGALSTAPSWHSHAGARSAAGPRSTAAGAFRRTAAGLRSNPGTHRQRRGPPPQLLLPSADEVASIPMPSMPALLDLSHDPSHVLLARLERVWEVLGVPAPQRMDMVLRYTARAAVLQFEPALRSWECAAAAVLQREGLLGELLQLRQDLNAAADARAAGAKLAAARKLVRYCVDDCKQLMWAFMVATEQVHFAASELQQQWGETLQVDGQPYPAPGAAGAGELQSLLVEASEVLE